ncbi:MAG TPA: RHS repeat domain-containing protein, partial [Allosphingosinicella sp.]
MSARAAFLLCALAAGQLLGAAPAAAQDAPKALSPLKVEPDVNGVNVVTGKTQLPMPILSVPAAPRLTFDRVQSAAPFVKSTRYGELGSDSDVAIQTRGSESESFHCVDTDCSSPLHDTGSRWRPSLRRFTQAGTGVVYAFDKKSFAQYIGTKYQSLYYASTITYPDGETLTFAYDSATVPGDSIARTYYRPTRITSSTGYYIVISYAAAGFDPESPTSGTPQQAALYGPQDAATPLARLTYSGSSVTDMAGRTYGCTGCANRLDDPLDTTSGSVQLPGEAAASVQYSGVPAGVMASVVQSVVKDGVQWTYSYANPRAPICTGYTAGTATFDRLTVTGPDGYNVAYEINPAACQPASIKKITDPIGRSTQYSFDTVGRPTQVTFPEGNGAAVVYDAYANIISKVTKAKPGSGLADITETASFNTAYCQGVMCYRPAWVRDGLSRQTDYLYNSAGQVTEETAPADQNGIRRKTYVAYESATGISRPSLVRVCGLGSTCGTAAETRTEFTYWGSTLLPLTESRIDLAAGVTLTTTYAYDARGQLLSADGPLPGTDDAVYSRYDSAGRKIWEIGPKGANGLRNAKKLYYRDSDDKPVATEEGTVADPSNPVLVVLTRADLSYDSRRNPVREAVSA